MMSALDSAIELLRHGLLAIADAEHRDAGPIDLHWRERGVLVEYRSRPAGKNDPLRLQRGKRRAGLLKRHDLAIDLLFAHAPGDELGHLRAEIDDENLVVGRHGGFYGKCCGLSRSHWCHEDCRRSTLTKKPSVSVRRGVISSPESELSAARA